ncbi:N-acetylmuramoyl-L-alanine amidase [hydrothermal vent metagenome]|uniref:N-acetylmuramoyl-L-alanine amidase n=1 Tax=hydrothermal vent metagenome TaxID=652676 RepID=A0A3B0S027_9ZZZZ
MGFTHPTCNFHPSPDFGPRREGALPDMVVVHYTGMRSAQAALERLCDPAHEVSAHYLIAGSGHIWQMVAEDQRAWHAGAGQWGGVSDVNSRSIGIELANCGDHPFAEPQMAALEGLLAGIMRRWSVPPERVIAHSDMAIGRKSDPGAKFDWRRLALGGLSIWPKAGEPGNFMEDARRFGYAGDDPDQTLAAFRLRFRPGVCGGEDAIDRAVIHDLARRFPVDAGGLSA